MRPKTKLIFLIVLGWHLLFLISCSDPEKAIPLKSSVIWLNQAKNFPLDFKNKITIMLFMTDQCEACNLYSPIINDIAKKYHSNRIQFLGIFSPINDPKINPADAKIYITSKLHITYPVIFDQNAKMTTSYQINGWPTLIVINAKGEIVKYIYGLQRFDDLDAFIKGVIK